MQTIGGDLAQGRPMTPAVLAPPASPTRFPGWMVPIGRVMVRLPQICSYWDEQIKKNGAYEERLARPYDA